MRGDPLTGAWAALTLLHLVVGLPAAFTPSWFAAEAAGLATRQPHYVRDVGVGELVLAALALLALLRPALRRPVALVLAFQVVLHATSHAVDGLGGAIVLLLLLQAGLLPVAIRGAASDVGASTPQPSG